MKCIRVADFLFTAVIALGLGSYVASLASAAPTLQGDPSAAEPSNSTASRPETSNPVLKRDFNKAFEDLTPGERIAIRAAAKAAYRDKTLGSLVVCADPGNMPFSNEKDEGFENKIAELLGKATGAKITFYWRPSNERGMTRQTFGTGMCDAMIDIPAGYESLLTTVPIYRTTYVLAYRNDENLHIKNLDDPELRKLRIGVYETSGAREVLLKHGIFDNVSVQTVSHDADINPNDQPWRQVQQVVDGKLDLAAVWGPFAGWVKAKGELRLPSLAPDIVTAIINGKHPAELSAKRLMRLALKIPTDWAQQRKLLRFQGE